MRSEARKKLVGDFPELLADDVVLQKEVYAHFGLTFFKFALVEHSLINAYVFSYVGEQIAKGRIRSQDDWQNAFDKSYAEATKKTFGNLAKQVLAIAEFADLNSELLEVKSLRDYFAHHFMRDESGFLSEDEGCWFLLEKIAEVQTRTLEVESLLKLRFSDMCSRLGIPLPNDEQLDELVDGYKAEYAEKVASGDPKTGWDEHAL